MPDIAATFKQKWGPLPVWGWGALVAGGVWAWRFYSRSPETVSPTLTDGFGVGSTYEPPASGPPPEQPAYGENLYLSFPYAGGYASFEGDPNTLGALIPYFFPREPETGGITQPPPPDPAPTPISTTDPGDAYQSPGSGDSTSRQ